MTPDREPAGSPHAPSRSRSSAREFDAIHDEVFAELGDRDRRYIVSMIEMHRRLVVLGRVLLLASRRKPAWVAGTATLSLAKILENMEIGHNVMHGQWDWMNDPQINSSTWDWDSASTAGGVEALPQLRPPHVHEHPRQGQGPRLRDHADRPAPEVAPGLPAAAVLQPAAGGVLRVGRGLPRPRHRGASARARSPMKQLKRELKGMAAQGAQPDRQGLRRVPAAQRRRGGGGAVVRRRGGRPRCRPAATPSGRRWRRTSPRTSSATSGPTRSSSAATSPTRRTPSARRRSRTRRAAASTSASCSARPTSRAARSSTSSAATSATRSSTTSTPTCRARATPRSRRA